jgi:K+-sensing histidine kinase KdpD
MAHELRTPLNAIIGFSEIIKLDKIKARERYPEYAGYIYDAGSILLDIINSILDLARIETGKVQLEEELIGFCTLVQSVITIIRPVAQKKSVEVDCILDDPSMMVYVDPTKLKQVLLKSIVQFGEVHRPAGPCTDRLGRPQKRRFGGFDQRYGDRHSSRADLKRCSNLSSRLQII